MKRLLLYILGGATPGVLFVIVIIYSPFYFQLEESETPPESTTTFHISTEQHFADPPQETTLLITGDVMLGRYVNARTLRENDMLWPWQNITDTLQTADIVFINLESPLTDPCPVTQIGMIFCGDTRHAEAMRKAGVHVAGIANNHGEDQGAAGFHQTIEALINADIIPVGTEEPALFHVHDSTFAFLAYNDTGPDHQRVVPRATEHIIAEDIHLARLQADVVIVMYHWGNEYTHKPTQRQIELAHFTVDAGADIVVGNHPHWVQPLEWYKGKPIMYSHGNFIFDQNWSRKTSEGVIGVYTFQGPELIDVDMISVIIERDSQPRLATQKEHSSIVQNVCID